MNNEKGQDEKQPNKNNEDLKLSKGFTSKLISDVAPALIFFISYTIANKMKIDQPLIIATFIFLPFAILGLLYSYVKEKRVSPIGIFTIVVISIFGGLSVYLKNDLFIKIRPTIVYSSIGILLLISVAFKRNLLKTIFDGAMHMPEEIWAKLALRAGIFNIFLAIANEFVWRSFPETTWVAFHIWGDLILNFIFWIVNITLFSKYMTDEEGKPLFE